MIPILLLSVTLFQSSSAFALPDENSTYEKIGAKATPDLIRLDKILSKVQDDKKNGLLGEKHYQQFRAKFRVDLDVVIGKAKLTPANISLHARILSRLGDSDQALAALGPALKQAPDNPMLHVTMGQVHFDRKDYPAALAEANAVLSLDPANKQALVLKHFSEGRIGTEATTSTSDRATSGGISDGAVAVTEQFRAPRAEDSPSVQALVPRIRDARNSRDMRTAMSLTQELMRTEPSSEYAQEIYRIVEKDYTHWRRVQDAVGFIDRGMTASKAGRDAEALEWARKAVQADPETQVLEFAQKVRQIADDRAAKMPSKKEDHSPKDGGVPLWPVLPVFVLGTAAYTVTKSRKTVESEDGYNENDRPQVGEGQRFMAGAILAGAAGAIIYLTGAYAAPIIMRYAAGPGREQTMRLAQSEAGAINPRVSIEMFSLYRAVSPAEYDELMRTGIFKNSVNSLEGKFFAETAEHATEWGQKLQGNGNFRIIRIQLPPNIANSMMRWGRLDGIGPARYADLDALNGTRPVITTIK